MSADYRNADVWNDATGTWLRIACRNCVHAATEPQRRVPVCMHDGARGVSIDRPTQFTARMRGGPCSPLGKLYEERR